MHNILKKLILTFALTLLSYQQIEGVEKLIILGSGPAGLTAAIFSGQSQLQPLVIQGKTCTGQIEAIYRIENYPGFPEGISGEELASRLHEQADKCGARFRDGYAIAVDLLCYPFKIALVDGDVLECESLIIATGTSPIWLGIKNEEKYIGTQISASALCDAERFANKFVTVVGGGDSAMEQALLLAEHTSEVTIIYKEKELYASQYLQERVRQNSNITVILEAVVSNLIEEQDKMVGIWCCAKYHRNYRHCDGLFIANGRRPNTDLFERQLEMTEKGYILTIADTTLTNIPGVFVAGDIANNAYRKVTTSAASGCMAAVDVARFLKSKEM